MAKIKTQHVCENCSYLSPKWLGKCPKCESWNTFLEKPQESASGSLSLAQLREEFRDQKQAQWVDLNEENQSHSAPSSLKRFSTGISELDRVLGGGLVTDSFTLLGGDPGIGKSTLLLQMADGISKKHPELKVFYLSAEESIEQIRGRAYRLGIFSKKNIFLASETLLEKAFDSIKQLKPDIVVIDSLQTFSSGHLESPPGSVNQVREIAARLMTLAKTACLSIWLVGHVTKEGNIAGPKTVEHMVDTVLYFEAELGQSYRLLRTVKNRFGSTRELGVFEMDGEGLREVSNPSSLFLSERREAVSGTSIAAPIEGSRPLLVEIQALVTPSSLAIPRRTAVGMDHTRVSLIAAILEKHLNLTLAQKDLFFNVAGGFRLTEPACDLAAAAAIWSSTINQSFPLKWAFIGELGLTGEVRRVSQLDIRIEEATRLGFKTLIIPKIIATSHPSISLKTQGLKIKNPKMTSILSEKENAQKEKITLLEITHIHELSKLLGESKIHA